MKFHVYRDLAGGWRWRLVARNGRIMADSAEAYVDKQNVIEAIINIQKEAGSAPIVVDDE